MTSLLVLAVTFSAAQLPAALWVDAVDAAEAGIMVRGDATYHVWLWASNDSASTVTLAGTALELPALENAEPGYGWREAGSVDLVKGKAESTPSEGVATIVLTADPNYAPADVAAYMRVFDQPKAVEDARVAEVRETNTVFEMTPFASKEEWEAFAARLKKRLLIGCGLFPMPEATALAPHIEDVAEHDDYIVSRVYFESQPGLLVTGNLYRPKGEGPFPGVICPHGHWENGRVEDGERGSVPARAITLARMGMVAFTYDMIGYVDSLQLEHNFGTEREKLWGVHPFAFQLWNSMRSIDFLKSLPYVDANRIACTGASGGGTQTFAVSALRGDIKAAAPVNMISHTMQGGCLCENAPLIRFDASNMEIGATIAPRPLLMVSATGDWTAKTPEVEFPAIRGIFELYGVPDRVENVHVDAGHNYNKDSREAMYRFFGKWVLDDGQDWSTYSEPAYELEPVEVQRVFPDGVLPEGTPTGAEVLSMAIAQRRTTMERARPTKPEQVGVFKEHYRDALLLAFGAELPAPGSVEGTAVSRTESDAFVMEKLLLARPGAGDQIPAILYLPAGKTPSGAVLLVHDEGKAAFANTRQAGPDERVRVLLRDGHAVMTMDPFLVGEYNLPWQRAQRFEHKFLDTFLPTDDAHRVQDVLTALAYLRGRKDTGSLTDLVGFRNAGLWCLYASALDDGVRKTIVDVNHFNNENDDAWVERFYVPSIRSLGGTATAAALISPRPLFIANTDRNFDVAPIEAVYALQQANTLRTSASPMDWKELSASLW